ncbi:HesB/IscA family protein [Streptomyces sp. NPDC087659]|uniref:HesB/IscA family protein n=1 Tax=Streptomyces sp. NPDC087659 TaxID=3365801 RepID=UPI0037FD7E6C
MVQETTYSVELTEAAVAKIGDLLRPEGPGVALQVMVQAGGCAGLRYDLLFTDKYARALAKIRAERGDEGFAEEDDAETAAQRVALAAEKMSVVWFDHFAMVIDPKSGPYLQGAVIDYHDTLQKSGFVIENPNASGSCACGDSFR